MLGIVQLPSAGARKKWIEGLFTEGSVRPSIVVADLPKKFELQKLLFREGRGLEDEEFLRVHEFWLLLHRRLYPEQQVISRDFLRATVRKFLRANDLATAAGIHRESEDHILEWIDFAHPLFLHGQRDEIRRALAEDERNLAPLTWWRVSQSFFDGMLARNWVSASWASALVNQFPAEELARVWQRPLVVDLGSQVSQTEIDLFEKLAETVEVTVLVPDPSFAGQFPHLMKLYQDLVARHPRSAGFSSAEGIASAPPVLAPRLSGKRFPSPLSEVKATVAQVRRWLDEGVKPAAISLLSPQIEEYWPMLRAHLRVEGVPYQKPVVSRLGSLLGVHQWLARLRMYRGSVGMADLEAALAAGQWNFRSEKFHALFKNIYERADLHRLAEVERRFAAQEVNHEELKLEEFLALALAQWGTGDGEDLLKGLHRIVESTPDDATMSFEEWLAYLERGMNQVEVSVEQGESEGVVVGNLSFGETLAVERRVFLGLQDSVFQKERLGIGGALEVLKFANQLGFHLKHPEELEPDFDLHWQLSLPCADTVLMSAEFGWEGQAEMPHPAVMTAAGVEMTPLSELCRWDELQQTAVLGVADKNAPLLTAREFRKFSATSVERFMSCPFIYTAEKDFRLLDESDLDLDTDARTMGSLVHRLFERISAREGADASEFSRAAMRELIEGIRAEQNQTRWDESYWPILREKLAALGDRFRGFEQQQREAFPSWKILHREKIITAYFNLESLSWEFRAPGDDEPAGNRFLFQAAIDRIDHDGQGHYLVIDYKTRPMPHFNFPKWMSEGRIQLAIYASIVDDLKSEFPGEVWGAIYYTYKPFRKDLGFMLAEGAGSHFPKEKPKGFDREKWSAFSLELKRKLGQTLHELKDGVYRPGPLKPEDCERCRWKGVCRADHLS